MDWEAQKPYGYRNIRERTWTSGDGRKADAPSATDAAETLPSSPTVGRHRSSIAGDTFLTRAEWVTALRINVNVFVTAVLNLRRRLADGGKREKHSAPQCGSARRTFDWSCRLIAWFMGCNLGRARIIVFGRVSIASVLLSRRRTKHIHTNGCTQSCVAARARPRTLFDTACSPLADRRAGNMTLLGAERAHKNGRSCNFDRVAHRSRGLPQPDSDFLDRRHPQPLSATQATSAGAEQRSRRCRPVGIDPRG